MSDLVKKLKSQIGDDVCEIYSHEALFSEAAAEITRLRAALADAQAVGFAAGVEAAARCAEEYQCSTCKTWFHPENPHDDEDCTGRASWGDRRANAEAATAIRALTPPDLTAAAARVLLADAKTVHKLCSELVKLVEAEEYAGTFEEWAESDQDEMVGFMQKALRAIAGDTP